MKQPKTYLKFEEINEEVYKKDEAADCWHEWGKEKYQPKHRLRNDNVKTMFNMVKTRLNNHGL